jgi:anionic cell wall polymer biosynthesis LytR-Cps2A-Psr (LCP) family protein
MGLVGYVPSFYVRVGLKGVENIINKIGGVYFNVPHLMEYDDPTQNLHIYLQPGEQRLDGNKSLQLLRYRHDYLLGDIQRVKVCQDFLKALAEQMLSTATLTKAVELAGTVADNVKTDLTADNLIWLAKQAMELTSEDIQFIMLPGSLVDGKPYWYPNKEKILLTVNAYFNPLTEDITTLNIVETPK